MSGDRIHRRAVADDRNQVEDNADVCGAHRAHAVDGQPMAENQVVGRLKRGTRLGATRCEVSGAIAEEGRAPRLVEGRPAPDPSGEVLRHRFCVISEPVCRGAVDPTTLILERAGEIPVIERGHRSDPASKQTVDQSVVERETGLRECTSPLRHHTRPADRESIGIDSQPGKQVEILLESVHVVAGHRPGRAVDHLARRLREVIPGAATSTRDVSLDLPGGRGHSEFEVAWITDLHRYPLTEPARRPRTKNRWRAKKTMSGMTMAMNAPAVIRCSCAP